VAFASDGETLDEPKEEHDMQPRDLRYLFAFNEWANARFVETLAALPEDRLTTEIPSSFPSLLDTLAHMVAAEWIWQRRLRGESPTEYPTWAAGPTLAGLLAELATVEADRRAYLDELSDEALDGRAAGGGPMSSALRGRVTLAQCLRRTPDHRSASRRRPCAGTSRRCSTSTHRRRTTRFAPRRCSSCAS
jgi:uncharacterized damage-inducible protein DinB